MRIEIDIPKEFEEHFNHDRFEDSLNRLYADVHLLAGKYERELAEMLINAFKESNPAYDIEKVVDELGKESDYEPIEYDCNDISCVDEQKFIETEKAIEIVKQGGVGKDV